MHEKNSATTDRPTPSFARVETILGDALALPDEKRAAFLIDVCAGDEALLVEVQSLLAFASRNFLVTGGAQQFVQQQSVDLVDAVGPGSKVGHYRLTEQIGAGGMSRVYLAKREDVDFEQTVAVKLMRSFGSAKEQSAQRFMTEQKILASLSHPNISKIIDGGVTENHRPYLVMEYVDGSTITEHCNDLELSVEARIDLFLDVCAGVRHAHNRLVVHRDIKPQNILVDTHNNIKLLDFGIAKLLGAADGANATQTGFMMFTPEYAAPEQVTGKPSSPATDLYALGVLLYELITGQRPYGSTNTSVIEQIKQVCETTPPKPSQTISNAGKASLLSRLQSNDLDLIAMKLLAKEPESRYGSCLELIQDMERWRDGLPVLAHAPGMRYRTAKFLTRHKIAAASAVAAFTILIAFVAALIAERNETRAERDRAVRAEASAGAINRFLIDELLASAAPEVMQGEELTVSEVLDRAARAAGPSFADQPLLEANVRTTLGRSFMRLGRFDEANENLSTAVARLGAHRGLAHPDRLEADFLAAELSYERGLYDQANAMLESLIERQQIALGEQHLATLRSRVLLGRNQHQLGMWEAAETTLLTVIGDLESARPVSVREKIHAYRALIAVQRDQRRTPQAIAACEQLLAMQREHLGATHPDLVATLSLYARLLEMHERDAKALTIARQATELARKVFDPAHSKVWAATHIESLLHIRARDYGKAERAYRQFIANYTSRYSDEHPHLIMARSSLATVLGYSGRFDESEALTRSAIDYYARELGERHPSTTRQLKNLNLRLAKAGKFDKQRVVATRMANIAKSFATDEVADATVMADMAHFLLTCQPADLRDADTALRLARRAVEMSERKRSAPLLALGRALEATGQLEEAIAVNEDVAALPEALHIHSLVRNLAKQYIAANRVDDGERFFQAHIERRQRARPAEDPLIGIAMLEHGRFLIHTQQPQRAINVIERAKRQLGQSHAADSQVIARANAALGGAHVQMGNASVAESLLIASFERLKDDAQTRTSVKTEILGWLEKLYGSMNKSAEASQIRAALAAFEGVPE